MPISYVFLDVGHNTSIHHQTWYAITSVLAHTAPTNEVIIATDSPIQYAWFGDRVRCVEISPQQQKEWRGSTDYFFRIKIKALQYIFPQMNHLVYLDADTVCLKELQVFEQRLNAGDFFMHLQEFALYTKPTKTTRQMWKTGKNKRFGRYTIDKNSMMWNSGVIALPAGSSHYLQWALDACDAMCQSNMRQHYLEQFALGLALTESNRLCEASEWFLHYWKNKQEWATEVINPFLDSIQQANRTVEDALSYVYQRQYSPALLEPKKSYFDKIKSRSAFLKPLLNLFDVFLGYL